MCLFEYLLNSLIHLSILYSVHLFYLFILKSQIKKVQNAINIKTPFVYQHPIIGQTNEFIGFSSAGLENPHNNKYVSPLVLSCSV